MALLVVLALALAGSATALTLAPPVSVTVTPRDPGSGSELTLHAKVGSKHSGALRGIVLRLARGFKFDAGAVAKRCKVAQAKQTHRCPSASRIGNGEAELTLTPGGSDIADLDLYLAPRQHAGDLAGVVVIADFEDRTGLAVGRIFRLDPDTFKTYGLQVIVDRLKRAFEPPPGAAARLTRLSLQAVGAHRTVEGHRRDLIRNPNTCGSDGWPWQVLVIHPGGDRSHYYGSIECSPAPTP